MPVLEPAQRVMADHLMVGLVYDLPEVMVQVQPKNISDWGQTFEMVLDAACKNLRQVSDKQWEHPRAGVWVSPWRDNYDTSRLLLTDLLQAHRVKGHHVAMVPNRDTLIVTGSDDEAGLVHMAMLAEKAMTQARPMTCLAFLLDNGAWLPWLPAANHPLYGRFHLLKLQSLARDYAEQKGLLDALQKKSGQDIFVASYTAAKNDQTGEALSYCVWTESVVTLLPETELIMLAVPKPDKGASMLAKGSWEKVQQVVGHLMKRQEGYPPRYLVKDFPTAEECALIGSG
jgi:hypothetical protein